MTICMTCRGWPCVCEYVRRLAAGAVHRLVAARAVEAAGRRHDPSTSCPCPSCYRVRLQSWEVSAA